MGMDETVLKLAPIFAGFVLAFTAKKLGWVKPELGTRLLRISWSVTIPALIFVSVSRIGLSQQLLIFPLLSAILLAVTIGIVWPVTRRMHMPRITEGTFRIAPLTINSAFVLPFLLAMYGGEGVTRLILFNAGYNPLLLLGVYGVAASYNPNSKGHKDILKRILIMPPLWALVAGLLVNVSGTQVPLPAADVLQTIGNFTIVLSIAALGMLFNPQRIRFDKTLAILGLRMGVGLLVGIAIVLALQLEGIDRAVVLALSAAPIGFNLLNFAAVEKLDQELAASAVSLSLLAALGVIPLILFLAG
jgi:predicted permease